MMKNTTSKPPHPEDLEAAMFADAWPGIFSAVGRMLPGDQGAIDCAASLGIDGAALAGEPCKLARAALRGRLEAFAREPKHLHAPAAGRLLKALEIRAAVDAELHRRDLTKREAERRERYQERRAWELAPERRRFTRRQRAKRGMR